MDVQTVVTDFEEGPFRAMRDEFSREVQSRRVFFSHLTQSTWRRIQKLGLVNEYNENEDF